MQCPLCRNFFYGTTERFKKLDIGGKFVRVCQKCHFDQTDKVSRDLYKRVVDENYFIKKNMDWLYDQINKDIIRSNASIEYKNKKLHCLFQKVKSEIRYVE